MNAKAMYMKDVELTRSHICQIQNDTWAKTNALATSAKTNELKNSKVTFAEDFKIDCLHIHHLQDDKLISTVALTMSAKDMS